MTSSPSKRLPHRLQPWLAAAALGALSATSSYAQDKLATIGAGAAMDSAGTAYSVAVSFNRTEATKSEPDIALRAWQGWGGIFAITPSAEANIGSSVDVSSNNVLVDVALRYARPTHRTSLLLAKLGPVATADKNFQTGVYYLRAGGEYVRYNNPNYPRLLLIAGVSADAGRRTSDTLPSTSFVRLVPALQATLAFRSGLSLSVGGKLWNITGDTTVITDGAYGLATIGVDYRFRKRPVPPRRAQPAPPCPCPVIDPEPSDDPYVEPAFGPVGLSLKYVVGRDEPLFERQHAVTFGIALYR